VAVLFHTLPNSPRWAVVHRDPVNHSQHPDHHWTSRPFILRVVLWYIDFHHRSSISGVCLAIEVLFYAVAENYFFTAHFIHWGVAKHPTKLRTVECKGGSEAEPKGVEMGEVCIISLFFLCCAPVWNHPGNFSNKTCKNTGLKMETTKYSSYLRMTY
jgi:hypothetical protein